MKSDDMCALVLRLLAGIAPEIDLGAIDPGADLRDELDLDSVDELTLVTRVSEQLGIDAPERVNLQLGTLDIAVNYLTGRLEARAG